MTVTDDLMTDADLEERPSRMDTLTAAVEALTKAWNADAKHEYRTLLAIRAWAEAQLPVKFGDRVRITECPAAQDPESDWYRYRECLVPGARAEVVEIDFNAHDHTWQALIRLEEEWFVSRPDELRYQNEPEGLKRWRSEGEERHLFAFPVRHLEAVE